MTRTCTWFPHLLAFVCRKARIWEPKAATIRRYTNENYQSERREEANLRCKPSNNKRYKKNKAQEIVEDAESIVRIQPA